MTNTTTNAPLAGKNVVITDRKQEGIDAALAQLGDGASGFVADSTSIADLTALAAFAKDTLGQIDILFANAGNAMFAPIEAVDEEPYSRQLDLNVKGAFFNVQAFLPVLSNASSIILSASAVHAKGAPASRLRSPKSRCSWARTKPALSPQRITWPMAVG